VLKNRDKTKGEKDNKNPNRKEGETIKKLKHKNSENNK
jgi:hypothetical protein